MKRNAMQSGLVRGAILASTILTIAACANTFSGAHGDVGQRGVLTISLGALDAQTILPLPLVDEIAEYRVTLDSLENGTIEETFVAPAAVLTVADVPAGFWELTIEGFDGNGVVIARSTPQEIALFDPEIAVGATLAPLVTGQGTLELEFSWPAGAVQSIEGTIAPWGGAGSDPFNGGPYTPGDAGDTLSAALDAGTYGVTLRFLDGSGVLLREFFEIAHIHGNRTTAETYPFTADDFNGPPARPSGLTADATIFGEITLSWVDVSPFNTGYLLERSVAGADIWTPLTAFDQNDPSATTFVDTTVEEGFTYDYRLTTLSPAFGDAAPVVLAAVEAARSEPTIRYVALPTDGGDDANPGTVALPYATIGRALSEFGPGETGTVRVAGGTFTEAFTVAAPVWIRGGHNPSDLSAAADPTTFPTRVRFSGATPADTISVQGIVEAGGYGLANLSVERVQPGGAGTFAAVRIRDANPEIVGVRTEITGAGEGDVRGLRIVAFGTSLVVSVEDSEISANVDAAATPQPASSRAIMAEAPASGAVALSVRSTAVDGGYGVGAVGILASGDIDGSIVDSTVSPGTATVGSGTAENVAIDLDTASGSFEVLNTTVGGGGAGTVIPYALTNNSPVTVRVEGSTFEIGADQTGASGWGLLLRGGAGHLVRDNLFDGSTATMGAPSIISLSGSAANTTIARNTLLTNSGARGIVVSEVAGTVIHNNVILFQTAHSSPTAMATGVELTRAPNTFVAHNTIAHTVDAAGQFRGIDNDGSAVTPSNPIVRSNLIVSAGSGASRGVRLYSFDGGPAPHAPLVFTDNAFLGVDHAVEISGVGLFSDPLELNDATITAATAGGSASGNFVDGSASPIVLDAAFKPVTGSSTEMFFGGADLAPDVTVDRDGNPRTGANGYTIGAYELDPPVGNATVTIEFNDPDNPTFSFDNGFAGGTVDQGDTVTLQYLSSPADTITIDGAQVAVEAYYWFLDGAPQDGTGAMTFSDADGDPSPQTDPAETASLDTAGLDPGLHEVTLVLAAGPHLYSARFTFNVALN